MVHSDMPAVPENSPLKRKHKVLCIILGVVAFFLAVSIAFIFLSPIPASLVMRAAFNKQIAVAPDNFEEMKSRVEVIKDLSYPSEYKDNTADIYIPKDKEGPFPVVLWIHGGAFVGGNKEDAGIYATALASEGIAVVCMNYQRAPEAKYPAPIVQTGEVYLWITNISGKYSFDINRFVMAGDSAGAHITAQFAAIQSNPSYADEMGFNQIVPLDTLKAVLLFCGPFNAGKMNEGSSSIMNFLIGRAAWGYFGRKDWAEYFSYQATISNHITTDFPPTFITDGNKLSFEEHGRELAEILEGKNVPVETYFIPIDTETAEHEYQFIMNTFTGKESFNKTVKFIKEYIE